MVLIWPTRTFYLFDNLEETLSALGWLDSLDDILDDCLCDGRVDTLSMFTG